MRNANEEDGKTNQFLFGLKGEILFSEDELDQGTSSLGGDISRLARLANATPEVLPMPTNMSMSMQFGKIAQTTNATNLIQNSFNSTQQSTMGDRERKSRSKASQMKGQ